MRLAISDLRFAIGGGRGQIADRRSPIVNRRSSRAWIATSIAGLIAACGPKGPPPDFAPDPGLVSRITSVRMFVPEAACPGETIRASYTAFLDDGREIPFATRYDEDDPPELHVVFLSRYSANAVALENGNWDTIDDPLFSAMEGFPLRVAMRAKPDVVASVVVRPDYRCTNNVYRFEGARGRRGGAGGPGPDVSVRMAVVSSPFYDRLIVAGIQVEAAPPFYVFADANAVPPADWLVVESRGGRGGRGRNGEDGEPGADGRAGCPGGPGGAGGAGGNGAPGGPGGRGGRLTVIAPEGEPFLAGLVEGRVLGGPGGPGGQGGDGGAGGEGGRAEGDARRCSAGADGANGPDGSDGPKGPDGLPGPRMQVITVPQADVFGARAPAALRALINYERGDDR